MTLNLFWAEPQLFSAKPVVKFSGVQPDADAVASMHEEAHRKCFIANSVRTEPSNFHSPLRFFRIKTADAQTWNNVVAVVFPNKTGAIS
jgi:hypothetical protein